MSDQKPLKLEDLLANVNQRIKMGANKGEDVTDPTDKGTRSTSADPNVAKEKQGLPPDADNGKAQKTLETEQLNAAGVNQGSQPSTRDGNADEKKTDGIKHAGDLRDASARMVTQINSYLGKSASSNGQGSEKAAADEDGKDDKDEKKDKKDGEGDKDNKGRGPGGEYTKGDGEGDKDEGSEKKADQVASDIDPDIFHKVARLVLEHEDGVAFVEKIAREKIGREAAQNLIKSAGEAQEYAEQWDQYEKSGAADIDRYLNDPSVSQEEKNLVVRRATIHSRQLEKYASEDDTVKQAYGMGAQEAGAMAPMAGAEDEQIDEQMGSPEDISPEEIVMLVEELLQAGEIDEATAQQVLAALQETEGGGVPGAEGGAPPEAEGGVPPELEEEMGKAASVAEEVLAEAAA